MEWIILIIFIVVIGKVCMPSKGLKTGANAPFCTSCGTQAQSKLHTRGHIAIEIIAWCAFLIPGLIYSVWRLSTRHQICSSCAAATLVPAGSPVAVKMRKELAA